MKSFILSLVALLSLSSAIHRGEGVIVSPEIIEGIPGIPMVDAIPGIPLSTIYFSE